MSEEIKKGSPLPVYAPPEQAIIPGYKKYISTPPVDWRKWEDGRGSKVDAPRYRGAQFTGKIVPPLTTPDGRPITDGSFQVVRDARGTYSVIDWSRPASETSLEDEPCPIMGRNVFRTRTSSEYAITAMRILARDKRDSLAGLPPDPVQCVGADGKEVFKGRLVLARHARGKYAGMFTIIDTSYDIASPKRRIILKAKTLKGAVSVFEMEAKRISPRGAPSSKRVFVGAPIAFDVPTGFGGFGGGFRDEVCPTPDSASWIAIVTLFAKTGKWCKTAFLIWGSPSSFPPEIVEQAKNYREEYLADPRAFYL